MDMLCQEMHELGSWVAAAGEASLSQQEKPFSHRGRAVTERRGLVVGGSRRKEESVTGL